MKQINGTSPLFGMLRGVGIRLGVTVATIMEQRPARIFQAVHTPWWTHREADLGRRPPRGEAIDPRGSVVVTTDDVQGFFDRAQALVDGGHWGPHGMNAFLAAHAQNCRRGRDSWSFPSVEAYNAILTHGLVRARLDDKTCDHCRAMSEFPGQAPPHASCENPNGCRCWLEVSAIAVPGVAL